MTVVADGVWWMMWWIFVREMLCERRVKKWEWVLECGVRTASLLVVSVVSKVLFPTDGNPTERVCESEETDS